MDIAPEVPERVSHRCPVCGQESLLTLAAVRRPRPCLHCGHRGWYRPRCGTDYVILELLPNIDLEAADIALVGQAFIRTGTIRRILVSFASLQYIRSGFLGRLVALKKKAQAAQVQLILCGVGPVIQASFQISRLVTYFEFADIPDDALGVP